MEFPSPSITVMEPSAPSLTVHTAVPDEDVSGPAGSGGGTSNPGGSRTATAGPAIPASANAPTSTFPARSTSTGSCPNHTAAASAPRAAATGSVIAGLPATTNGTRPAHAA